MELIRPPREDPCRFIRPVKEIPWLERSSFNRPDPCRLVRQVNKILPRGSLNAALTRFLLRRPANLIYLPREVAGILLALCVDLAAESASPSAQGGRGQRQ